MHRNGLKQKKSWVFLQHCLAWFRKLGHFYWLAAEPLADARGTLGFHETPDENHCKNLTRPATISLCHQATIPHKPTKLSLSKPLIMSQQHSKQTMLSVFSVSLHEGFCSRYWTTDKTAKTHYWFSKQIVIYFIYNCNMFNLCLFKDNSLNY